MSMEWRGGNHIVPTDFRDDHLPEEEAMTEEQNKLAEEIERLAALSVSATQGRWSSEDGYLIGYPPKSRPNGEGITQFSCAINPNFPRSKADGEFVAALVNWFRANQASLRAEREPATEAVLEEAARWIEGIPALGALTPGFIAANIRALKGKGASQGVDGERKRGKYRLVYNKVTKKIEKVSNFDGLAVESFDPPEGFDCAPDEQKG